MRFYKENRENVAYASLNNPVIKSFAHLSSNCVLVNLILYYNTFPVIVKKHEYTAVIRSDL